VWCRWLVSWKQPGRRPDESKCECVKGCVPVSLLRRVIVGTCDSPGSIRALRYARDLAVTNDAALIPVHAWIPPGGDLADRRAPNPLLRKVWQDAAWRRLRGAIESAFGGPPDGVQMTPAVVRGAAGEVLVGLANQPYDVLVVGAGRRGALARIGHGRVAQYCVARARCPVVAVPPSALAGYARGWARAFSLRRHGLSADEALDGADWNIL